MAKLNASHIIRWVFPNGTRLTTDERAKPSWDQYPDWPPDLFAIAAILAERSGCYAELCPGGREGACYIDPGRLKQLTELGFAWKYGFFAYDEGERRKLLVKFRSKGNLEIRRIKTQERQRLLSVTDGEIQMLWNEMWRCDDSVSATSPVRRGAAIRTWTMTVLELIIIADEACAGIGFPYRDSDYGTYIKEASFIRFYQNAGLENIGSDESEESERYHENPHTYCIMATSDACCVLPKTRTPNVGCTLRSLTHHLALTPPRGSIRAEWNFYGSAGTGPAPGHSHQGAFNLLTIPFPYNISGRCFHQSALSFGEGDALRRKKWGWFDLRQQWLCQNCGTRTRTFDKAVMKSVKERSRDEIVKFLCDLVHEARSDVGQVNGVLLPEMALDKLTYDCVVKKFESEEDIEFFISGVSSDLDTGQLGNFVATTVFFDREATIRSSDERNSITSSRGKHHRWKLDQRQIQTYSLGDALDPTRCWWENCNISNRKLDFFVFRAGSCFTSLICEDLARIEPCQTLIRSVGANLVIALLMDGPQLISRWPGRYATALADDPGCAVLTLTSLGLVNRSGTHQSNPSRSIALWKDDTGLVRELTLPRGDHAYLLTLTSSGRTEVTLDGRTDLGSAHAWTLSGAIPIRCATAPEWLMEY